MNWIHRLLLAWWLFSGAVTPQSSAFAQAPSLDGQSALHFENHQLRLFADQPISPSNDPNYASVGESIQTATNDSNLLGLAPSGLIGGSGSMENFDFSTELATKQHPPRLMQRLWQDQLNFYSRDSLMLVGGGLIVGATMANTQLDDNIQRHLHSSLHQANSDEWLEGLHANKELGDGRYTLPLFAGAWVLGSLLPESEFSTRTKVWGERTLRGFAVGAPPVLLLQRVTGSSRPGESSTGSEWEPWRDNNGVSGHAFMGALPFITAAKMSDRLAWKATFYAASALAPLSRTADGAHYPSQVALGWGMAFVAATAVHATDNPNSRWRIMPTATPAGSGMAIEYRF